MASSNQLTNTLTTIAVADAKSPLAKISSGSYVFLTVVLMLSTLYLSRELKRSWVPSDEGTFAECADRVLHGRVPHIDYHEAYTGGLSYLNAAAFRLFGTNLASMRYMLFAFFLPWVPVVYYAASRFVRERPETTKRH